MYSPIQAFMDLLTSRNWLIELTRPSRYSALQKSAIRASRRAFRPAIVTGFRAASARFASDTALYGKIYQVIGAVVDGK
jgi:hypothetical protein